MLFQKKGVEQQEYGRGENGSKSQGSPGLKEMEWRRTDKVRCLRSGMNGLGQNDRLRNREVPRRMLKVLA